MHSIRVLVSLAISTLIAVCLPGSAFSEITQDKTIVHLYHNGGFDTPNPNPCSVTYEEDMKYCSEISQLCFEFLGPNDPWCVDGTRECYRQAYEDRWECLYGDDDEQRK